MHCLRGASAGKSQKVLVVQQAARAFCLQGTHGGKTPCSGYRAEEIQEIKASPIRRVFGMTVANVVQPFLFSGTQLRNDWPFGNLRPNGYDLIMADPPWRFGLWSSKGEEKSPQAHYHTMSIPEIKALPVAELAAADCLLWLWATAPLLPQALDVMRAWGFCVAVGTRVLTADLRWVSAEDLDVGQKLLAFDDQLVNGRRYYRWATVVSNGTRTMDCYKIHLADGRKLVASAEHAWLMRTSHAGREGTLRWIRTEQLPSSINHHSRVGPLKMPTLAPVQDPDRSYEAGFLSAAFDGEGSIDNRKCRLVFSQLPNAMLDAVHTYLIQKNFDPKLYKYTDKRPIASIHVNGGLQQVLRFLMQMRPPRLLDRWLAKDAKGSLYNMGDVDIEAVEHVGKRECATLQTDTGTYIAEGFGAHNTYKTMGGWHKTTPSGKTAFGTGYVMRSAFEPFVIGKRGNPKTARSVRNLVVGQVREHSRKPEEAYAAAEALMPGAARAELFSRTDRPGWAAWGDEAGKFSA